MMTRFSFPCLLVCSLFLLLIFSCKRKKQPPPAEVVSTPELLKETTTDHIRKSLSYASGSKGDIGDSTILFAPSLLLSIYEKNEYAPFWSNIEQWDPRADSLFHFINESNLYGLFPEDYHFEKLQRIRERIYADSLELGDRRDAALWSKADIMLTDAFMHILKDISLGRLPVDSVTLRKDTVLTDDFLEQQFNIFRKHGSPTRTVRLLEPKHPGYHILKAGIPFFLEKADYRGFTHVPLYKEDSIHFTDILQTRLFEQGYISFDSVKAASGQLEEAIRKFQKEKGLTVDGRAGEATVRALNTSDRDRFVQIAITLDKYKLLPEKMPLRYLWVNLPSFYMQLRIEDSVILRSKIICGKPATRTPLLNSSISEIITYPQWTVPTSIIRKEMLPAIKKDPNYLAEKGFSLIDKDGMEVDPFTVDWAVYKKDIPYKVVQGSGDDNALGILKFNFPNKYAVYLHDTNQRSLFSRNSRSMSHGCVRVQEWEELALYLVRHDDSVYIRNDYAKEDSLYSWLERKEKHSLPIRDRLPVFFRYHTCEPGKKGIVFYDDMYGEDSLLREKYFPGK